MLMMIFGLPVSAEDDTAASSAGSLVDIEVNAAATHAEKRTIDRYVLTNGVRLHYVRSGNGQPVVLLHGNDGTLQDFTMSIFGLVASKYDALAIDRPGHGLSKIIGRIIATPEMQARTLHHALHKLGIEKPILVAHSWSGSLALSYALQFPRDLSGIVLLGGLAYDTERPSRLLYAAKIPILGTVVAHIFKVFGKRGIRQELEDAFEPDPAPHAYVSQFLSSLFRVSQLKAAAMDEVTGSETLRHISSQYSNIKVPVVIVTGDQDKLVHPKDQSYRLHQAIPHSKLIVVRNAGHELQFTRPQAVMQAIDIAAQQALASSDSAHKPIGNTDPEIP